MMRRLVVPAIVVLAVPAFFSVGEADAARDARSQSGTFAFMDVHVVPMDSERILSSQTVIVRDGRIAQIGAAGSVTVPAGATRIDGRGKYLMPGLAEMHAHIPGATASERAISDIMFLYVANGITTIRGMLGAPNQLTLRDASARNEIVAPTIIVGAPSLSGQTAPTPDTAGRLVRAHKAAGYDFLKLHPGLTRQVYDAIVSAARTEGITFAGHISSNVGLAHTLEARQSTIDHLDGYLEASVSPEVHQRMAAGPVPFPDMVAAVDPERVREWAGRTRAAGAWNVPTMALWETFFSPREPATFAAWPEMMYASPAMVEAWSNQKQNMARNQQNQGVTNESALRYLVLRRMTLKALADSGAPLLMGTDSPQMFSVPGFSLHREIRLMQEAGLTPFQILQSGTHNVARYVQQDLGGDGSFGTVAAGNRADLILLDANPLQDARNIRQRAGVMVRGRWFPAAELDTGLEEMARRHRPNG